MLIEAAREHVMHADDVYVQLICGIELPYDYRCEVEAARDEIQLGLFKLSIRLNNTTDTK